MAEIDGLRVIPSQANYVMVEITNGLSAAGLTRTLIANHNILIKDLSAKVCRESRQYIRLAVRNRKDNDRLLEALQETLGDKSHLYN